MDNVLLSKASIIERCLKRIEEEYRGHEDTLATNFTRQDSIILNLQRACEAAIDAAMHTVRVHKLGIPQQSREAFQLIGEAGLLSESLASNMQQMVGFRNVAVQCCRQLDLEILKEILNNKLDDFRAFVRVLLQDELKVSQ